MFKYEIGDIVGVAPAWYQAVLLELMAPYVHAFHHLLVGTYVEEDDDWIVLESIGSGVRIGRLSWYRGQQVMVYRPPQTVNVGQRVFNEATVYGRQGYDYLGLLQLAIWGIPKWIKGGFKPLPYNEIPSDHNKALICTELVVEAYDYPYRIVPEGVGATPAAIKAAQLNGLLEVVYEGAVEAGIVPEKWKLGVALRLVGQGLYRYLHSWAGALKLIAKKLSHLTIVVITKTGKAVRDLCRQIDQVRHARRLGANKKPQQ